MFAIIVFAGPSEWSEAGENPPPRSQASAQSSPAFTNGIRSFETRGIVRELPVGGSSLLVTHEEIAGFMPSMTMRFDVRDTNELHGLRVGDRIAFKIQATDEESWIAGLGRIGTNTPAGPAAAPGISSDTLLHAASLKPGDPMPDFDLLAEDGRTIRLSDFGGKAIAFTFIFTRCPLPDFCPRMNRGFARARELLIQNSDAPLNWQFLSVSFDPEFDNPGRLARYATQYRGQIANQWLFASASAGVLSSLSPLLDFRFATGQGSFQHNLRTVVLDARRRVHRYFDGNQWTGEELAQAMIDAARGTVP